MLSCSSSAMYKRLHRNTSVGIPVETVFKWHSTATQYLCVGAVQPRIQAQGVFR